jgi:hypothetical protein
VNPRADAGVDYFNRGHWLTGLQVRVSLRARRRMYELFRAWAGDLSGKTVLDVGATPDLERQDSNCMLPWFHDDGARLSLHSLEQVAHLKDVFPYARILPPSDAGQAIPAAAGEYDWVTSSAVLEHVGARSRQVDFVRECARAGQGLFLTTPNRFHWLEFHTKLPLIHWLPRPTHRRLLKGLGLQLWADEAHLNLVGARELEGIANEALGADFTWEVKTISSLGMPSNLVLLARRSARL